MRLSTADCLLGLGVRILPGYGSLSGMSVECCQVNVSATVGSLVQRSLTDCDMSLSVIRNLKNEAASAHVRLLRQGKKKIYQMEGKCNPSLSPVI